MAEAKYWRVIEPIWEAIDIYSGPKVFLQTFRAAPRAAALLFAAHFCQSEICNGGFWQFFYNSTGVLAPEAVLAFRDIQQVKIANVVEQAMAKLGNAYPRERKQRQAKLAALGKNAFDSADQTFYELIDEESGGFQHASDEYARRAAQ